MNEGRRCAVCKQPIEEERLEAIPGTVLCTLHAQQIGRYGGEFKLKGTQAKLNKASSLKQNYGDVTVDLEFNDQAIQRLRDDYERSV